MRITERLEAVASGLCRFARAFRLSRDGGVAMMFAIALPPLTLMAVAGVDIHRATTVRMNLQDALDAATLAAARSGATTEDEISRIGMATLRANMQAFQGASLLEGQTQFRLLNDGVVVASSKARVDTLVSNMFLGDLINVGVNSEVIRSSKNLEVALVLDITGSMLGQPIIDLRNAASELVDLVVQDVQTPYYSRMSVVPYSMGVNVGNLANTARGTPPPARGITNAVWHTGNARNISAITRASTVTITSNGHGFQNGNVVHISGVNGMTQINGRYGVVTNRNNNSFQIQGLSSSSFSNYSSGGTIRQCLRSDCAVTVTSNGHGFQNGSPVHITSLAGMPAINNQTFTVRERAANTFVLEGSAPGNGALYNSGGQAWCASYGCQYFAFTTATGNPMTLQISSCVAERTGTHAYRDSHPSTALVSANYPTSPNPCPSQQLMPLTSNRTQLRNLVTSLQASGSTAGQIGLAWGWYTVSPVFGTIFSGEGRPAPHDPLETMKVVILMTDGEFNTAYCNGVVSRSSTTGSGALANQINCNATNGGAFTQARALCNAMKQDGIILYTVGFNVLDMPEVGLLMRDCASSPGNVYMPEGGTSLREAFRAIGRDISSLRIAR